MLATCLEYSSPRESNQKRLDPRKQQLLFKEDSLFRFKLHRGILKGTKYPVTCQIYGKQCCSPSLGHCGGKGTLCSHCHPLAALAPSPQPGIAYGDIPMLGSELFLLLANTDLCNLTLMRDRPLAQHTALSSALSVFSRSSCPFELSDVFLEHLQRQDARTYSSGNCTSSGLGTGGFLRSLPTQMTL